MGFLGLAYPWVLAAHVIFVIFLMASLFMMPR
ncbi:MAG: CopD family protein, partial [Sphingobium sp.]